ncbi:MAG: hypothetical protein ACLSGV_10300 [Eubacterium sp.]
MKKLKGNEISLLMDFTGVPAGILLQVLFTFFSNEIFHGDSCVLSLVSNDVADGSVLFCNTIYPEKSK